MKDCLRLTGVQVRSLNDVRVRWRVDRVRWVGVLAELPVVTPPGVLVVRSSHD